MSNGIGVSLLALSIVAVQPATADTWDLKPDTLAAFDRYVRLTEARMAAETGGKTPFLWLDRQTPAQHTDYVARLKRGEVVVSKLQTKDGGKDIDAPDGLLHHWIGTVFLPGVKLDRAIAFVQDYARYPELFAPIITRSKIVNHTGNTFNVQMRTTTKKVITVTLDGDYSVEYRSVAPNKMYTRSLGTNFYEVSDAGTSSETRREADKGTGYLWRLNTYCSFEERADGTYEQCESISLTRGIPFIVAPVVRPFTNSVPREALEHTLGRVRAGLTQK